MTEGPQAPPGHYALGHPAVPLASIKSIDDRLWDRKGIAYLDYDVNGQSGTITLDDFVYQREPVDAIYESVDRAVRPDRVREEESEEPAEAEDKTEE